MAGTGLDRSPQTLSCATDQPCGPFGGLTGGTIVLVVLRWPTSNDHHDGSCGLAPRLADPGENIDIDILCRTKLKVVGEPTGAWFDDLFPPR